MLKEAKLTRPKSKTDVSKLYLTTSYIRRSYSLIFNSELFVLHLVHRKHQLLSDKSQAERPNEIQVSSSLHFAWVVDDATCILVTRVSVCLCLSLPRRMPTPLHGPGCNLKHSDKGWLAPLTCHNTETQNYYPCCTQYINLLNSVVKNSLMFVQYFEWYAVIHRVTVT